MKVRITRQVHPAVWYKIGEVYDVSEGITMCNNEPVPSPTRRKIKCRQTAEGKHIAIRDVIRLPTTFRTSLSTGFREEE